ncbi:MAG: zinc ribbon domain-containing protein [Chloroflexus sp.]
MYCPHCHTKLPDDARFCIECGAAVLASTGATIPLPVDKAPTSVCTRCRFVNPGHARFCVYCGEPIYGQSGQSTSYQARTGSLPQPQPVRNESTLGTILLIVGLGLLLPIILRLPPIFWPNLLMILGIAKLLFDARRGKLTTGLRYAIWLFGLAVLFIIPRLFFPGLILLIGLTLLLESGRWSRSRP